RRCAPLSVSIRASLWYCSPNSSHSPRSSLEAEEPARALSVGDELVGETMPLRHGRRVYRLAGLRPPAWYEVKISYPASVRSRSHPSHSAMNPSHPLVLEGVASGCRYRPASRFGS
uniref:Uncharacterized protein n=2 Tax=Aegilops tauschii subsp. strangulata TaxID=200361 RepID=A0A453M556_AEGTS